MIVHVTSPAWTGRLEQDVADALSFSRGCSRSPARVRRWQVEHLLLMLLLDPEGPTSKLLRKCGVEPRDVERAIMRRVKEPGLIGSTDSSAMLDLALAEASALGEEKVSAKHVLLASFRTGGIARETLSRFGLEPESLRSIVATNRERR
jgi:ATP-dependent Clp protease ATP-binding subunit ClpA